MTGARLKSPKNKSGKLCYVDSNTSGEITPKEYEERYRAAFNLPRIESYNNAHLCNEQKIRLIQEKYDNLLKEEEIILHAAFDAALEKFVKNKQALKDQMKLEIEKL